MARKDGTRKEGKWMMALPPTAIAEHTEDRETHRRRRRQSCLF